MEKDTTGAGGRHTEGAIPRSRSLARLYRRSDSRVIACLPRIDLPPSQPSLPPSCTARSSAPFEYFSM